MVAADVEVRVHSLLPFGSTYWAALTAAPEETWSFVSGILLGILIPCAFFSLWALAHGREAHWGAQKKQTWFQHEHSQLSSQDAQRCSNSSAPAERGARETGPRDHSSPLPSREGVAGSSGDSGASSNPDKAAILSLVERLENSWTSDEVVHDDGTLRVWHRPEGGSLHSFKYETIMPFEPAPCVALAREIDLMPTWHKFISKAVILEDIERVFGGIYAYCELWMPWPLKNRALLMKTAVYDALDDSIGAFVVDVSSSDYPGDKTRLPTSPEECPRLSFGSYTAFSPLPPDEHGRPRSKWTLYFDRTDYQVPNLPTFVLAFFYKVMAPFVIQVATHLVQTSFQPGSNYASRMDANPGFYGTITERCRQRSKDLTRGSPKPPSRPLSRLSSLRTLARPPPKKSYSCPQQLDLLAEDLGDGGFVEMRRTSRLSSLDDGQASLLAT